MDNSMDNTSVEQELADIPDDRGANVEFKPNIANQAPYPNDTPVLYELEEQVSLNIISPVSSKGGAFDRDSMEALSVTAEEEEVVTDDSTTVAADNFGGGALEQQTLRTTSHQDSWSKPLSVRVNAPESINVTPNPNDHHHPDKQQIPASLTGFFWEVLSSITSPSATSPTSSSGFPENNQERSKESRKSSEGKIPVSPSDMSDETNDVKPPPPSEPVSVPTRSPTHGIPHSTASEYTTSSFSTASEPFTESPQQPHHHHHPPPPAPTRSFTASSWLSSITRAITSSTISKDRQPKESPLPSTSSNPHTLRRYASVDNSLRSSSSFFTSSSASFGSSTSPPQSSWGVGAHSGIPGDHIPSDEFDEWRHDKGVRESVLDLDSRPLVKLDRGQKKAQPGRGAEEEEAEKGAWILDVELAEKLRPHLPPLLRESSTWRLVYSLDTHGISLHTLYRLCEEETGPILLAIRDSANAVFGAFASESFKVQRGYFGNGSCFLWKQPSLDSTDIKTFHATGTNDYLILTEPHMFALGGGEGHFGLWIDKELYNGHSGPCQTFGNEQLSATPEFQIVNLEIWGFEM
ncbi:oxidation resistance protein 1 [Chytridiales sp. JEL 0842]|nr:oxidation resistance protein 1 [Chytridiales sp. JEL 0842]